MEKGNEIYDITDLIRAEVGKEYKKDYNRIRNDKKFNINFNDYTELYIDHMIIYFESIGEYDKSGYLNLKRNGFKEHK